MPKHPLSTNPKLSSVTPREVSLTAVEGASIESVGYKRELKWDGFLPPVEKQSSYGNTVTPHERGCSSVAQVDKQTCAQFLNKSRGTSLLRLMIFRSCDFLSV